MHLLKVLYFDILSLCIFFIFNKALLEGAGDEYPESCFYMKGDLEEALADGRKAAMKSKWFLSLFVFYFIQNKKYEWRILLICIFLMKKTYKNILLFLLITRKNLLNYIHKYKLKKKNTLKI